jgi:hypothetical protein
MRVCCCTLCIGVLPVGRAVRPGKGDAQLCRDTDRPSAATLVTRGVLLVTRAGGQPIFGSSAPPVRAQVLGGAFGPVHCFWGLGLGAAAIPGRNGPNF